MNVINVYYYYYYLFILYIQIVFATPGMLHAGLSLQIFKKWAEDDKNMVANNNNVVSLSCF